MIRQLFAVVLLSVVAITLTGCPGSSKETGKFSNQDKPKSADGK